MPGVAVFWLCCSFVTVPALLCLHFAAQIAVVAAYTIGGGDF